MSVNIPANSIGSKNGYRSKTVPSNVSGQRSAGLCRNPPTAGATHDATPNAIANIENARACCVLSVVSPMYVFTTPALPFNSPVRNRPLTHCA